MILIKKIMVGERSNIKIMGYALCCTLSLGAMNHTEDPSILTEDMKQVLIERMRSYEVPELLNISATDQLRNRLNNEGYNQEQMLALWQSVRDQSRLTQAQRDILLGMGFLFYFARNPHVF